MIRNAVRNSCFVCAFNVSAGYSVPPKSFGFNTIFKPVAQLTPSLGSQLSDANKAEKFAFWFN